MPGSLEQIAQLAVNGLVAGTVLAVPLASPLACAMARSTRLMWSWHWQEYGSRSSVPSTLARRLYPADSTAGDGVAV